MHVRMENTIRHSSSEYKTNFILILVLVQEQ